MAITPKLKVEQARTDELIPYAGNAKVHTADQVDQIANSIEEFGFSDPVGVWTRPDGRLEIVEGHGRVMAAKLLGLERVPIVRLDHLDDDARRAYVHVHNQTTLTTGFDLNELAVELDGIPGFDWSDFGFESISPDDFGTSFELSDADGPMFHTITLELDDEQYELVMGAITDNPADGNGNASGNSVAEIVRQWANAKS